MKLKFDDFPDYEHYKNSSCIMIGPKETSKKTPLKKSKKGPIQKENYFQEPNKSKIGMMLNNTIYEPNIIKNLRALYKQYSEKFSNICNHVLNQKFKAINKSIYKFCVTPFVTNSNGIISSLILNTDQNRQEFTQQLSDYIKRKALKKKDNFDIENPFHYLYPKNFTALDKLFVQLKIHDDEIIEKKEDQLMKIIVIYDIQSINSVVFNIFISRMLEYSRRQFCKYIYVLLFDIAYDPKNLYDKFNVSFLPKIRFYTIANTPSNFLYHEILYDFIYKKNSGFYIPKSQSLKEVLDSISLHQISIESFKHYFNLILFQFFFMHQWNDDEYLLYMEELNEKKIDEEKKNEEKIGNENNKEKKSQKKRNTDNEETYRDNKRKEIFENKLNEIYFENSNLKVLTERYKLFQNNINDETGKLLKNYKEKMKNWELFKLFYKLFEGFIEKFLSESKDKEDCNYYFLYNFLQYDSSNNSDDIIKKRAAAVIKIFEKIPNQIESLKNYFYPNLIDTVKAAENLISDTNTKNELKELNKKFDHFMKTLDNIDLKNVSNVSDNFNIWLKELLQLNWFIKINAADNEHIKENCARKYINVYHRYAEYKYMIEPPLMTSLLQDLFFYCTENGKNKYSFDIKGGDFEFKNILRAYFKCLMNLDSNFKLNHFFYDFLVEFKITEINDKNKELVENYRKVFLVLSYWFNLVGVFQKKKGKKQGFIKNYYSQVNYFEDNKEKNFGNLSHLGHK